MEKFRFSVGFIHRDGSICQRNSLAIRLELEIHLV